MTRVSWLDLSLQPAGPFKRSVIRALLVLMIFCLAAPALPQQGEKELIARPVPNEEIPLYTVVHQFFVLMAQFQEASPAIYERRLLELGIEESSREAEAFAAALAQARPILAAPSVDPDLAHSESQFLAFQEQAIRDKVYGLAQVYGGLLADLEAAGFDPDRVRSYLEERIRPGVALWVEVSLDEKPVAVLHGDPNLQLVLPFEQLAEASYRKGESNLSERGGVE